LPSPKQAAASRVNAQKSTGPRSATGKAVSRFNALKHGICAVQQIMFDEKAEDLAELSAEYHEHHRPADPGQCLLVETLVHNEWRLRRMRRVEANLWRRAYNTCLVKNIETTLTCTSGDAFATDSPTFERLQRVVNSCERDYHRALKDLQTSVGQPPSSPHATANPRPLVQEAAADPAPYSQPKRSKTTSTSSASFRYNSQTPPSVAPEPPDAPLPAHPLLSRTPARTPWKSRGSTCL
jgi:hypothetical protein